MKTTLIHCCGCYTVVVARLTSGAEIYPHRNDLYDLPFWKCDSCHNFVGCHHKTKDRTKPLGVIPTKELRRARQHIHKILDPLWQSGKIERKELYTLISDSIGWEYHTASTRSIEEARKVYKAILNIRNKLQEGYKNNEK